MADNEFRVSDVPAGSAKLVDDAAVCNVDGNFVPLRPDAHTGKGRSAKASWTVCAPVPAQLQPALKRRRSNRKGASI
jgi:hypothetical protein